MLSSDTIEQLFDRLLARYGSAWRAKWQGIETIAVKADWADVLRDFTDDAVAYGLSYLPADFPPTAGQFASICRRAPTVKQPQQSMLPAPKPDKLRLAAELQRLHDLLVQRGPLDWAKDLKTRHRNGEMLTPLQQEAYRAALGNGSDAPISLDAEKTLLLKAELSRQVQAYATKHGIDLTPPAPETPAARVHREYVEPEYFAEADR